MMKKLALSLACVSALLCAPVSARAGVDLYDLDKPHTQIIFVVDHLGFSHSYGKFTDYEGQFQFDADHPEQSSVTVTIKTASLQLDDAKWNEHMSGPDFFNVEKFPEMTFKSTGITVTGEKTADITGDLTLLGVTKPVTLHTVYNKSGKYPFGDKYGSGFSATATLKRSDFGMGYGIPMVGDDVNIIIEVEGIRRDTADQAPYNK